MNNEVESYVGELRELRELKESLTKQNEELKYEINSLRNKLNLINNERERKPAVFASTNIGLP